MQWFTSWSKVCQSSEDQNIYFYFFIGLFKVQNLSSFIKNIFYVVTQQNENSCFAYGLKQQLLWPLVLRFGNLTS